MRRSGLFSVVLEVLLWYAKAMELAALRLYRHRQLRQSGRIPNSQADGAIFKSGVAISRPAGLDSRDSSLKG